MSKLLLVLFSLETLLLLFALMEPIVCPDVEMFSNRHDRSSKIYKSEYISDNLYSIMENETSENRSDKPQQQQHNQKLLEPETNLTGSSNINDTIKNLFYTGNDRTYDNTFAITPIPHMQADESFVDKLSQQQQEFKVQRTSDGKLNLVFNDYYFFQKTQAQSTNRTPMNRDWVYPGMETAFIQQPHHNHHHNPSTSQIPSESGPYCEDDSFNLTSLCTNVRNYPNLESILKPQYSKFEFFFGSDIIPPKVTSRNNFLPTEEYLCESDERTIYPKSGETIDNNMRWIVNYGNYTQGIRVEKCRKEGEPCSHKLQDILPIGYKATCKQHYIYRPLVALSADKTLITDQFKIPSCCKCVLTQINNG